MCIYRDYDMCASSGITLFDFSPVFLTDKFVDENTLLRSTWN